MDGREISLQILRRVHHILINRIGLGIRLLVILLNIRLAIIAGIGEWLVPEGVRLRNMHRHVRSHIRGCDIFTCHL